MTKRTCDDFHPSGHARPGLNIFTQTNIDHTPIDGHAWPGGSGART